MAWLGLATAATPIGWVVAAAAVCGTAYYGASRYFAEGESEFVDQIPKYINTPIDLLGFSLFGLIGGLSVRVVESKGCLDPHSRKVIMDHFCKDWGYDPAFVERALALLEAEREAGSITATAQALAGFQASNPDCNASAMQKELLSFLRDVVEADGVITASEQAALDEIAIAFETQRWVDLGAVGRHAGETAEAVWNAASKAASTATAVMGETAKGLGDRFASVGSRMRSDGK